ncbi:hypothetical protein [Streptomyces sp. NPDC001137]|uniref:hypothetical protein n=1 Tax=Streptomyces sp. NPDC001137 TaxID=3154378 RepID=UPI0033167BF6
MIVQYYGRAATAGTLCPSTRSLGLVDPSAPSGSTAMTPRSAERTGPGGRQELAVVAG